MENKKNKNYFLNLKIGELCNLHTYHNPPILAVYLGYKQEEKYVFLDYFSNEIDYKFLIKNKIKVYNERNITSIEKIC